MKDLVAERAVLAGVYRYGADAYYDVADILNENAFTLDSNAVLWKCIKLALEENDKIKLDVPTILSSANRIGLPEFFKDKQEMLHLNAVLQFPVELPNVRKFGAVVAKLSVGRLLREQLNNAGHKLSDLTGEETYAHILGIAEDAIFNFSSLLNSSDGPQLLGCDIFERLDFLTANPVDQIGISTGYGKYDFAIGGGLRRGTVNVIGARPKTGKTLLADNIGSHIAGNIGLPVLNLDTEMLREDHQHRTLAMLSEVGITDIETGKFSKQPDKEKQVWDAAQKIKNMKYFHQCIGGMPFEEQLAVMRRWIVKEVGMNGDNTAKPCVIIYDYIKMMSSEGITKNLQEYQALGFMMTGLHNFALRYKVPILSFVQLNRDGINKESTDAASGSDRIIWLCSNFTIYKKKSDEEVAQDGPDHGVRKLVPIVARHGQGLEDGDYINMRFQGYCGKISEGKTRFEVASHSGNKAKTFEVIKNDGDNEEDVPFE
jgi:replicative DNA helicase